MKKLVKLSDAIDVKEDTLTKVLEKVKVKEDKVNQKNPLASIDKNMNKLIRQYFPRNTDLKNISDTDIYLVQEKLNNRPRKKLKYLSPNEFWKSGAKLT